MFYFPLTRSCFGLSTSDLRSSDFLDFVVVSAIIKLLANQRFFFIKKFDVLYIIRVLPLILCKIWSGSALFAHRHVCPKKQLTFYGIALLIIKE